MKASVVRPLGQRALACVILAVASVYALTPALARADGDPASDVLLAHSEFVPYDANLSGAQQSELAALLKDSARSGFPIRVALIPSEYDLGSVGVLWKQPATYARFLGVELSLTYKQRLLVVMPNGFGFNWPGHSPVASYRALSKVSIGKGGAGLLAATKDAVSSLAAAEGIHIESEASPAHAAPTSESARGQPSQGHTRVSLVFLLGAGLAVFAAFGLVVEMMRSQRRKRREAAPEESPATSGGSARAGEAVAAGSGGTVSRSGPPRALRWLLPGTATLSAAVLIPLLLLSSSSGPPRAPSRRTVGEDAPATFPAGLRAAPSFTLEDENGHRVSPAAYRGRPVIITFIDPLCRHLCPIAGHILSRAIKELPSAERPEVIAVSVDIYADKRADLMQDFNRWKLVPQWQWAVGTPNQLAEVWKNYGAEVSVETKHIAGTTVHYITHSEMAYVIDGKGYERDLFLWPYTVSGIDAAVRSVERS